MPFGKLNQAQRRTLEAVIKGRLVTDLGAGDCRLAYELLKLGALEVVALDKEPIEAREPLRVTFVRSYFVDYHKDIGVAFMSWPPNWMCPGLVNLLARAPYVVYLGKNTDGDACGFPKMFEYLLTREVISYVPDKPNTLIVYGPKASVRAPTGEEHAGLLNERIMLLYEEVEPHPNSPNQRETNEQQKTIRPDSDSE
jgi:hypothetical protein